MLAPALDSPLRSFVSFVVNFLAFALGVFHHHHGIRARRDSRTGHDFYCFSRRHRQIIAIARPHLSDYAKKR